MNTVWVFTFQSAMQGRKTFSAVVSPIYKLLSVKKKEAKYNYLISK